MGDSNDKAKTNRREAVFAVALLCALTAIVFANTFKNDFVGYDDQNLVVGNESIRSLSPDAVARMFAPKHRGNYQPLRTLSYAVDYAIWGMDPFGYQLTNIILHMLTVIGVWLLAKKLVPGMTAFFAALIFAVHPIHVESVTWISARKDVLCLVFFLAAILLHEESERRGKSLLYVAALAATALALLSKLNAVTIPPCIFLLDVCRNGWPSSSNLRRKIIRLLPHVALVCLIIGLNLVQPDAVSSHGDALAGLEGADRVVTRDIWLSMPLVVCRYIGLLFAPFHLSTHYDVSRISRLFDPRALAPISFLLGLALAGLWGFRRGKMTLAFAIGWFAITFLPVSNIVPAAVLMTDRYMHIPSIGFVVLMAAVLMYPAKMIKETDKPLLRMAALLPVVAIVALFSVQTIRRNSDWRDTESLFTRTLLVNPRSFDAYLALGALKDGEGDFDGAIEMYREALEVSPNHYRVLYNLGVTYGKKGYTREGTRALERSRDANPEFSATRINLALIYHEQKRYAEAIAEHAEALRLRPEYAPSHGDLGRIYLETGEYDLALRELNRALEIQPDLAPALVDRAGVFMRNGRIGEAEKDLRRLESQGIDTRALRARLRAEQAGGQ